MSAMVLLVPLVKKIYREGLRTFIPRGRPIPRIVDAVYLLFIGIAAYMLVAAQQWSFNARIGPTWVAGTLIAAASLSLVHQLFFERRPATDGAVRTSGGMHMDVASDSGMPAVTVLLRAAIFFGWFLAFLASMAFIGLIPTVPIIVVAYMRLEGREPWKLCVGLAASVTLMMYLVFDRLLHISWPNTFFGDWFPSLAAIVPSM
jgi:putative tricarboxylic transport membrane protein